MLLKLARGDLSAYISDDVSVPSIGSMLLKRRCRRLSTLSARHVSVPSIGSMLLKPPATRPGAVLHCCFSTLYRVDAIEAPSQSPTRIGPPGVSVPSIGSMLLKPMSEPIKAPFPYMFQYPLSGRCY